MARTWNFQLSPFLSLLPTWDQAERGKYAPSSHHTGSPSSSLPTFGFLRPTASEQDTGTFLPLLPPWSPPTPARFCVSAQSKWCGNPPYSCKLWINSLCLFSCNWSWFISTGLSTWEGFTLIGCTCDFSGIPAGLPLVPNWNGTDGGQIIYMLCHRKMTYFRGRGVCKPFLPNPLQVQKGIIFSQTWEFLSDNPSDTTDVIQAHFNP